MVVKTFRGLLADGGQDRIRLSTNQGKVGYRMVKFQLMPSAPGTTAQESIVKIYTIEQSSVTGTINFTESDLMASAYLRTSTGASENHIMFVVFDQEMVNQDIYITHSEVNAAVSCNYYIELEAIPLDEKMAEYSTIKDLRSYQRVGA